MASTTYTYDVAARSRRRSFFLPREHGAWGMLLVPLVVGAAVGNPSRARLVWILFFAIAALGLFCLRTPLESALGFSPFRPQCDGERRLTYSFILYYASATLVAVSLLLFYAHAYALLLLGFIAASVFLLQALLKRFGRSTRLNSELAGSLALSSTAAGAYYLAAGRLDATALLVWFASELLSANQIHFVQLRIHASRAATLQEKLQAGKSFLVHQVISLFALVWLWRTGYIPGLALAAFVPIYARGFAWFTRAPRPLQVRRLGVSELSYAVAFGVIFIAGFQLHAGL